MSGIDGRFFFICLFRIKYTKLKKDKYTILIMVIILHKSIIVIIYTIKHFALSPILESKKFILLSWGLKFQSDI